MGFFSRLFGGKKEKKEEAPAPAAPAPPAPQAASTEQGLQKMRQTKVMMEKRAALLEANIEQETARAKEKLAKKDKNGALLCMKRKKAYEAQLASLLAKLTNITHMEVHLEGAVIDAQVMNIMAEGARAIKSAGHEPGKIDVVMDEVNDAMGMAQEVSDALAQPLDMSAAVDDDDLLAELADEVANDEMEAEISNVGASQLPARPAAAAAASSSAAAAARPDPMASLTVPTTPIRPSQPAAPALSPEEEELRRLEAELAM